MTPPAVSVILPTYQRRDWVCRAVRSVFAQRYSDWELIVVDDGSTDGTGEALRAFGPRLRYLWQENRGVSAARNAGLRLARGEIVAFLDSDDRWLPDHLETVVAVLERRPDAVLVSTCPRSDVAGRDRAGDARLLDALPLLLVDNFVGTPSGIAARRDQLLAVGGFDEGMMVLEDGELWLRLATRGPFAFLQRRTIVRQHTRGSLVELGSRNGGYLHAMEQMARSGASHVIDVARSDRDALAARAAGKLRYWEALRALVDDEDAARAALREACERLPELSSDPWFVDRRVKTMATAPDQRLRCYAAAAALWPDPSCDTALFLRVQAALHALGLRRFRQAYSLWPLRAAPGLLARQRSVIAILARRRLAGWVHSGRDAPVELRDA
jgi:Glycosyl transferase family 2